MYKIQISMVQSSGDTTDGNVLIEEYSEDLTVHLLKTQTFTKHLTEAVNAAVKELTDMALGQAGGPNKKPAKR